MRLPHKAAHQLLQRSMLLRRHSQQRELRLLVAANSLGSAAAALWMCLFQHLKQSHQFPALLRR
jgi:hypothetical protein